MKLSANAIKLIAIILMVVDHAALLFVSENTDLYYIMQVLGRTVAPVMCFFIAEGFRYTRSRKKYLLRMVIFAVIAQLPYSLMVGSLRFNVMYTFAVSIVMLMILECKRINVYLQTLLFAVCLCLSTLGDWGIFVLVWILLFYRFKGNFARQSIFFFSMSVIVVVYQYLSSGVPLYQLAVLFGIIPLSLYSGERGKVNWFTKWGFFVFYPLHIAVLVSIKYLMEV